MVISITKTVEHGTFLVSLNEIAIGWAVSQHVDGVSWKALNQDYEVVAHGCGTKVSAACKLVEAVLSDEMLQSGALGVG